MIKSWEREGEGKKIATTKTKKQREKKVVIPTWFEHATFWSGVRRATIAPRNQSVRFNLRLVYKTKSVTGSRVM